MSHEVFRVSLSLSLPFVCHSPPPNGHAYFMSRNIFIILWPIPLDYEFMTCHVVLRRILALHQHAYLMSHIMFISVYPWLCNYAQVMTHEFVLVFLSLPFAPLLLL